mmetsp:Transcript_598/g.1361  ORF Transcript_598/g.1361 Transcript_598/m.1361 type:complete len:190 (-) Transcript_598:4083-4652(-)
MMLQFIHFSPGASCLCTFLANNPYAQPTSPPYPQLGACTHINQQSSCHRADSMPAAVKLCVKLHKQTHEQLPQCAYSMCTGDMATHYKAAAAGARLPSYGADALCHGGQRLGPILIHTAAAMPHCGKMRSYTHTYPHTHTHTHTTDNMKPSTLTTHPIALPCTHVQRPLPPIPDLTRQEPPHPCHSSCL